MRFKYTAINSRTGYHVSDVVEAADQIVLIKQLRAEGLKNIKVRELTAPAGKSRQSFFTPSPVKRKEVKIFTRQLASTLGGGLILSEALDSLAEDLENTKFGEVIRNIRDDVHSGVEFSQALSRYPNIFSPMYTATIKSGEATGWLHKILAGQARYLEDCDRLREKVRAALTYPLFVLFFAVFIVIIMLVFIVPRFKILFSDIDRELPALTKTVIGVSEFLVHNLWVMGAAVVLSFPLFSWGLRFRKFRVFIDNLKMKIPLIGKEVLHKTLISQFCRTMSLLLWGGVSLPQALKITKGIINHVPMRECVDDIHEHILAGGMISEVLKTSKYFPNFVYKMVSIGEKSGNLHDMFSRISDYYEEEVEFSLLRLTALLEPVLIIFVGVFVLIIVLSLYLPIMDINKIIY